MPITHSFRRAAGALVLTAGLAGLAACGGSEEKGYEADVVDQSGGDIIVNDVNPSDVPVDLPDTPMTNVPPEEGAPNPQ
ncbi:hypothetical protein B2G71_00335 [Novosphingobium sp. PC22D]|uniref:hypothetical protein n=1 Tax=Novosphingobium sp. PC22D TaxID=1962403 RepID=UPI000BF0B3CE|nr:hypothetical protein [Novosphingobium sp. PC22D]PEQ14109.1 hypothetical protein B2G71_00335 [Novosphingobium sp. PC22D]